MRLSEVSNYVRVVWNGNLPPSKVRFWEKVGLLGTIHRDKNNNQRDFSESDVRRVLLVYALTELKISTRDIIQVLDNNNEDVRKYLIQRLVTLKNHLIPAAEEYLKSN